MRKIALLFALVFVVQLAALGQIQPICDTTCGPDPGGAGYSHIVAARPRMENARGHSSPTIAKAEKGTILVGSESYNYAVPILSLPGRNGLDLNLTLFYNSRVWTVDDTFGEVSLGGDRDVPSYGFQLGFGYLESSPDDSGFVLTEADGTKRLLTGTAPVYETTDSSHIQYHTDTLRLYYKSGLRFDYEAFPNSTTQFRPKQVKDTNGNLMTIHYVSGKDLAISYISDTLGRNVNFNYDAESKLRSITQTVSGSTRTWASFDWSLVPLEYNFSGLTVTGTPANGTSINVLSSVTLLNGTKVVFTYGGWAIVNRIDQKSTTNNIRSYVLYDYPAGTTAVSGHPTFTHQTIYDGVQTVIYSMQVTKNAAGKVTSYTVTAPTVGSSTTQTTTNLIQSGGLTDGLVQTVQTKDGAGTVQRQLTYTWETDTNGDNPRVSQIQSTLSDSGQTSKITYSYDAYGNVTETDEYDFGATTPKRKTLTTFAPSSGFISKHIVDRPTQVVVKDGSDNLVARTDFAYDGSALSPQPVGVFHHDDSIGSTRGNLTQIVRYSDAAGATGAITRNFTYDWFGNVITADLDCCNQKTYAYSSTYQYAYPTSVTSGSGTPQLTTSATYNTDTGTIASSTDENGHVTNYTYNADRLATVTRVADGFVVTTDYDDSSAVPAVTVTNNSIGLTEQTFFDGLGRPTKRQITDGTNVVSVVETSYDAMGRPSQTSNPHGPNEAQKWTTISYDVLGRQITVTPPGGAGSYGYSYLGNQVTSTDPAGMQKKTYSDALGRLIQVDEPGGAMAATSGSGSLNISGTEQSTQVGGSPATPGTGWVTINGSEQSAQDPDILCPPRTPNCNIVWDMGTVSITVNGLTKTVNYGQNSTASSLASSLAAQFNGDASSAVTASVSVATITFTAKTSGASTNYSLSSSSSSNRPDLFGSGSFWTTQSGSALTGGADALAPTTVYDSGTVTLTVNGFSAQTSYGQGSTSSNVASSLTAILNGSTSPVTASLSGSTITLTAKATGSATNYSVTGSSTTNQSAYFASASFSAPNITLSGGMDANNGSLANPYTTTYAYDALDDLTTVTQGAQARTYAYDSLGRVTSVATPETAGVATTYTYTDFGAVQTKTDPRGVVTTYGYDGHNRLETISYSDGTPGVTYGYDSGANALGKLTAATVTGGPSESFTYDSLGRVVTNAKTIAGVAYNLGYGYDAFGNLTQITYPSGKQVVQGYDNIERLTSIGFNGVNYLTVSNYNPAGQVTGVSYGNGVAGDFTYNDRLQLDSLRYHNTSDLLNLAYNYGSGNNGQIRTINAYSSPGVQDAAKSVNYYYDNLGRLTKAETQDLTSANTFRLEWAYDRYGNRLSQSLTGGTISTTAPQLTVDAITNRITTAGYGYDAAGNMTNDTLHTYAYDAENRIKTLDGVSAGYVYDAAGLRVIKGSTVYVYSGTNVIAEYASGAAATSPSKEYVYSGSSLLATVAAGATTYAYPDHLSTRVEANSSGTVTRTFGPLPFGEQWYQTGTDSKWKFTSYERDTDTGLDYAVFRSYSSRLGRFMQTDRLGGRIYEPQSMNRYAYVINDPTNLMDPLGLRETLPFPGGPRPPYTGPRDPSGEPITTGGDDPSDAAGAGIGPGQYAPLLDTGKGDPPGGGTSPIQRQRKKDLDALAKCIKEIYGIDLKTFTPIAPGSNGYFHGVDSNGREITVETDVSHSSWYLGLAFFPAWFPMAGRTPLNTDPHQTNYVASDKFVEAAGIIQPTQIHELAHSLDQIVSGSKLGSSEKSADRLMKCIEGKQANTGQAK